MTTRNRRNADLPSCVAPLDQPHLNLYVTLP
jgi:hypothetical protein